MIYLSLGSNVGNRLNYLKEAVLLLQQHCLDYIQCSIVLETPCILPENAPPEWDKPFLNMIVSGVVRNAKNNIIVTPEELLLQLKQIEYDLGRQRVYERWSPRVIDIDILLWDDRIVDLPQLHIPHSDLQNRPFLTHLLTLMRAPYPMQILEQADQSACFLRSFVLFPQLMGVVNVTPDSFSDGGQYADPEKAIAQAVALMEAGASIIDIGAQSTRPGAVIQTPEVEFARLKPVLDALKPWMVSGMMRVSVDTFQSWVVHQVLDNYPVTWINDISGDLDDMTLIRMARSGCSLCFTHNLGVPPSDESIVSVEESPVTIIFEWARHRIAHLMQLGFSAESLIMDPGIGFGKNSYQNRDILRHIEVFKNLGVQVLVGHARKSFMRAFSVEPAVNRDIETLAISSLLAEKVDFLRVHDVADHMRFFVAQHVITCN